jgi:hypothetical protein
MINIEFDLSPWINMLEHAGAEMPEAISRALNRGRTGRPSHQ